MSDATRDEVCVVACAEAWRGDGAVLASAFGIIPTLGVRLARATFEPDLLVSDGEALLIANDLPIGSAEKQVEGWLPFRTVFDMVWSGRRHVMMGATQIDRHGNQNISALGDHAHPKVALIGVRGAPGNTINHATSYWVAGHSARTFVERVDVVSGVGTDRGAADLRRVVTNLCVFDFEVPDGTMRVRSVHPGVSVDEVLANTAFAPVLPDDLTETRLPTEGELRLIREVLDPGDLRKTEVKP
ncbi:MAG TPA: CoA-transferase [Actinomycetota bacterium]|nr:CoA-transferase [Actinomycetota bacterium]